jgi:radical SAM protein with 4Fe4S-binding SPASM domain
MLFRMHVDTIENSVLSVTVNPILKHVINCFDEECAEHGSLLLNSLRDFLGEPVDLCPRCQHLSRNIAKPLYAVACRLLRLNRNFMRKQFLQDQYGEAWFKGFGLMMKGVRKYGVRVPFTPAGPFEIVWNFTYQCNLKCKHCYENAGGKNRSELSTDGAKQALDIISRIAGIGLPALSFSGGEPLARKDFFEVVAHAKRRVPYVSIASNGTLITKDNAKRIKDAKVDYVEISIDGATPGLHDSFRGIPGAFDRAIQGVKNCVEAGVDTCIATVMHRDNFAETKKIIGLAKELDSRFIHFNYIPTGRAREHFELDLTPEERFHVLQTIGKEIISLYLQAKEEEHQYGRSSIKVDRFFSTCPQYASVTRELSRQKGEKFLVEAHYAAKRGVESAANFLGGCGAGRLYCALEPNGDVKPCVFLPTNEETVLGNILNDDFEEIWNNNASLWKLRTRENLESYVVSGESVGCGSCKDKYICGGCRARAYGYFKGNVNAPDIGCIHNKAIWDSIIATRR